MPADDDAAEGRQGFGFRLPRSGRRRMRTARSEEVREQDKELVRDSARDELPDVDKDEQEQLPHPMAQLYVFPLDPKDRSKGFGLRGFSCCAKTARDVYDPQHPPREPLLSFAREFRDVRTGGTLPDKFVLRMNNWSVEQVLLGDWLNECRNAHDGKLELVIWDDTGFSVPWELLWLRPSLAVGGSTAGRLGALVTVTRWLSLHQSANAPAEVKKWNNEDPYNASGSVAAYIAAEMDHDKSLFDRFVVETVGSMSDMFTWLQTSNQLAALAMVYVACHGEFSDNADDCILGEYPLGLTTELNHDLIRVREGDTLVFLNGCNTGSIAADGLNKLNKGTYNDGALRGFAKFFLLCGAASVLATTGAVFNNDARQVAADLLDCLTEHPETTVADAVRGLRARAAERMTQDLFLHSSSRPGRSKAELERRRDANEELHQLLHPFMYVCFGSPRTRLALTAREGPADTAEPTGTGG